MCHSSDCMWSFISVCRKDVQAQKKKRIEESRERLCQLTHYCFLPLPLPLLGPFELPLLVVPAVLLPLQPLVLVLLVAVIPAEERTHMTSPS